MTVAVYLLATLVNVKMNIVDALTTMLGGGKMGMLVHVLDGAIVFPLAYCGFLLSFSPGPELREWADLRANAMVGLTIGSSANDRGGCVQFSHGWGQGRRDVAVPSPDLRRVAGLLGWRCYREEVRG